MDEKLIDILVEICDEEGIREEPEMDLIEEGLLDSLALVELLVRLEDEFGITISPTEYEKGDFSTFNKIKKILADKGAQE